MAKARAIDKRRKTVRNIRKITRTMQLIATSKFQQSLKRATASRPYTDKITELVEKISSAAGEQVDHPLLRINEGTGRALLFVITSNRGLCGGYNASLLRQANAQWKENEAAGRQTELHVVGKKGIAYFTFLRREIARSYTRLGDTPSFDDVAPLAEAFIREYSARQVDAVDVVYTRFVSAGQQEATCVRLLPFQRLAAEEQEPSPAPAVQYDYSPPPAELMGELLPATVKVRLFQYFMDAIVSESAARMVAMKAATDAADDMIKSLSQQFNRARQTQITLELLDIVGGAQAIS